MEYLTRSRTKTHSLVSFSAVTVAKPGRVQKVGLSLKRKSVSSFLRVHVLHSVTTFITILIAIYCIAVAFIQISCFKMITLLNSLLSLII
jgi:hypothetical protein